MGTGLFDATLISGQFFQNGDRICFIGTVESPLKTFSHFLTPEEWNE